MRRILTRMIPVPEGFLRIAQRFERWETCRWGISPEGTAEGPAPLISTVALARWWEGDTTEKLFKQVLASVIRRLKLVRPHRAKAAVFIKGPSGARGGPAPGLAFFALWTLIAAASFHAAYARTWAGFLMVIYLFALLQLAKAARWGAAFYSGLAVGFLIAAVRLSFFWKIFSAGAVSLWLVFAFWIGLFVALARLCLRRLPQPWNWLVLGICICYDLSYSRVTDRLVKLGAQALIVPTMDVAGWGSAEHKLHARVAPIRAAEYGLPIFRLASSGPSQWVDSTGLVLGQAPFPGEGAMLAGVLRMQGRGTLPWDRWLGPVSVVVTTVLVCWFFVAPLIPAVGKGKRSRPVFRPSKRSARFPNVARDLDALGLARPQAGTARSNLARAFGVRRGPPLSFSLIPQT